MNINIIYASETGTAEGLAKEASDRLTAKGHSVNVLDAEDVTIDQLPGMETILIFSSTWGDGEPPTTAEALHSSLRDGSVDLSSTRFAVFALGSDMYDYFCQSGKDFDEYLSRHGSERLAPVQLTNEDHDDIFPDWTEMIAGKLS